MDIEVAKHLKTDLEQYILQRINLFEKETGLIIKNVYINTAKYINGIEKTGIYLDVGLD